MTLKLAVVYGVLAVAFVATAVAADTVSVPVNGNNVPLVQTGDVKTTPTSRGDNFEVAEPDQTFTESDFGETASAGVHNGEVVRQVSDDPQQNVDFATDPNLSAVNPALPNGRRLLKNSRKMLGELSLSGDGVSAGNSEAGVQADAYGQGEDDNLQSTHIRPHGVEATTTVAGEDTTGGVGANPDCVGTVEGFNEGPACAYVNGK